MSNEETIRALQQENSLLRERIRRLERELARLAESVAKQLEQSGDGHTAGLIREAFIYEPRL